MRTIAMVKEKTETVSTVFFEQAFINNREGEDARPGCTCDRWGHPRPRCSKEKPFGRNSARLSCNEKEVR